MKEMKTIWILVIILILILLVFGISWILERDTTTEKGESQSMKIKPNYEKSKYGEIYLAGGCFWGTQAYLDRMMGILYTDVGYANGETEQTDYYSIGKTGHAETVYVVYDPEKIPLEELLEYYFGIIDPTSLNQQGNDIGTQYRTGIYYVNEDDRATIENMLSIEQMKWPSPLVVEVQPLRNYVLAEDYHQDYLEKNPAGYCHVNLTDIPREKPRISTNDYSKPSTQELKKILTENQFLITQEKGTEPAFDNDYWDNKDKGLYVDVVTGEPLFLSEDKYDSGTGWPSFVKPIQWDVVTYRKDQSLGMIRIEVRSRVGDSHLGHLFEDGPTEEGGLRYCMNSGALRFISFDEMEAMGYGAFLTYFQ
jgi:peptide methionine sulfoxide reductase msrA/msrB